ncbi:hypothetical protein EV682_101173 [Iodobacter fluviatilis]|uniref:Uncharacterized protein n=1 Tax=Iodobacter fluviatilis TaxID=537 RepID=A0A377Q377_9NEIS|nr:hypothetical protein EV682_101173 [Iodobacter fluviatilis]STQ89180.1 Uncharacterised protein [Iodobacter fluviatilis]
MSYSSQNTSGVLQFLEGWKNRRKTVRSRLTASRCLFKEKSKNRVARSIWALYA